MRRSRLLGPVLGGSRNGACLRENQNSDTAGKAERAFEHLIVSAARN
jgi:hypothetical protein